MLLNDGLLAFSASCPVTATVSPSPDVLVTASTKFLASVFPIVLDCLSKGTWKNPTVRFALTSVVLTRLPVASYGLVTGVTLGIALISSTSLLMRKPTLGSVKLAFPEVPNTTSSVSPEWAGATDFNKLMASKDWVCGNWKLFE